MTKGIVENWTPGNPVTSKIFGTPGTPEITGSPGNLFGTLEALGQNKLNCNFTSIILTK